MNKNLGGALLAFLCIIGAFFSGAEAANPAIPVIQQSFASKEIQPDGNWKVYITASDPDGEMKYIFACIEQPGVENYPASIIRIRKENLQQLSGYIYLNTVGVGNSMNSKQITLSVHIQDKSGQFSTPVVFPLSFDFRYSQAKPPEGVFQEKDLGPIMIRLKPTSDAHPD